MTAAAPSSRPDFAGLLAARLGLGPREDAPTADGPPTVAAFLRNAYRPPTAEVSDAAVAAALANVRGEPLPAPRSPAHDQSSPLQLDAPAVVRLSAAPDRPEQALPDPRTRAALHRAVLRTRAAAAVATA